MKYSKQHLQIMATRVKQYRGNGFKYSLFITTMVLKTGRTASYIESKISEFAGIQH